ncbi:hypothetical protein Scep_030235 [Stephania cephalantha]|uniref:Uncharacterized protein n=1 Tax=Stephania cephalantha TaxID=152367 RepID=A0AAP0DZ69_9MAGN
MSDAGADGGSRETESSQASGRGGDDATARTAKEQQRHAATRRREGKRDCRDDDERARSGSGMRDGAAPSTVRLQPCAAMYAWRDSAMARRRRTRFGSTAPAPTNKRR